MRCYYHPEVEAIATCTNCGKAICSTCSVNVSGRVVCQSCIALGNIDSARTSAPKQNNPLAMVSLIIGILGLVGCLCGGGIGGLLFGIAAAITGYIARKQLLAPDVEQEGLQFATIGLGLGLAEAGLSVIILLCIGGVYGTGFLVTILEQLQQVR